MQIQVFNQYEEMCKKIACQIADIVKIKPNAVLCLAAGHTSLGIFKELIEIARRKEVSLSSCMFVGLDEWAGLGRGDDGSCIDFMYHHLFTPLGLAEDQIIFYNGRGNLEDECKRVDNFLKERGPIDFILLGMGMNGHLGLNEPETPFDRDSHVVDLDETTKTVGQKYFKEKIAIKCGITMGINHVSSAREVILAVNGHKKAPIVKQLLDILKPDSAFPASFLKGLSHSSLFVDLEAMPKICQ